MPTQPIDFERLVMEHKSTIYSVCYMFTETRLEADDLFQEVLISLWQGKDSFRGDSSLRSWVYRVSMNTCISYKRKKHVKTVPLEFSADAKAPDSPQKKQARMLHDRISKLEPFDRAICCFGSKICRTTRLQPSSASQRKPSACGSCESKKNSNLSNPI